MCAACPVAAIYDSHDSTPSQKDLIDANTVYRSGEPDAVAQADAIVEAHIEARPELMAIDPKDRQAAHWSAPVAAAAASPPSAGRSARNIHQAAATATSAAMTDPAIAPGKTLGAARQRAERDHRSQRDWNHREVRAQAALSATNRPPPVVSRPPPIRRMCVPLATRAEEADHSDRAPATRRWVQPLVITPTSIA